MNKPGSFKRVFEIQPFMTMLGAAGAGAYLLGKLAWPLIIKVL